MSYNIFYIKEVTHIGKELIHLFDSMMYFSENEYLSIICDTMITTLYFLNVRKELNQIISVCSIPTVL